MNFKVYPSIIGSDNLTINSAIRRLKRSPLGSYICIDSDRVVSNINQQSIKNGMPNKLGRRMHWYDFLFVNLDPLQLPSAGEKAIQEFIRSIQKPVSMDSAADLIDLKEALKRFKDIMNQTF